MITLETMRSPRAPRSPLAACHSTTLLALFAGIALPALALGQTSEPPSPPPPPPATEKAPVIVGGKTLFYVQERVYSFTPEDRAKAISERVMKLYKDPQVSLDAIHVEDQESVTEIVLGDRMIMAITDGDAKAAGKTRQALAKQYAEAIRATAKEMQEASTLKSILLGALYTLLATIVLVLILTLIKRVFPRIYQLLRRWQGTRIRSVRLQKVVLMSAERITDLLITLARGIRLVTTLVLLYFYLPLVFSFFPWTRGYAAVLFEYVMQPVRFVGGTIVDYLPNLFYVIVILVVAHYSIKLVRFFFREVGRGTIELPGFYRDWADPTFSIARFLIIVVAAVAAVPYLPGSKSPAFQGISLFLGLLFSLGSTSAVANIVGGIVLTYTRAFQIGDRVKIGETIGDVIEKTLLVTRIRTIKNVDISIPNSMVLSSHIINYSSTAQEHGLILHTGVTIGYDAPWRKVHELLISAANATPGILKEPKPFVLQTSLDDFYVSYEINAFTDEPSVMARIYSDLHQNIQDKFNEGGVEIMSPHYGARRDGNMTTIPQDYLPKDYSPPSFRIAQVDPNASAKKDEPPAK